MRWAVLFLLVGCSDFGQFENTRLYLHPVFDSQEQCESAMAQGINCYESVEFCSDGTAVLMVSEVVTRGTYEWREPRIDAHFDSNAVPGTVTFEYAPNGAKLEDDWIRVKWNHESSRQHSTGGCDEDGL